MSNISDSNGTVFARPEPNIKWPSMLAFKFKKQRFGGLDFSTIGGDPSSGSVNVLYSEEENYGSLDIEVYASNNELFDKLKHRFKEDAPTFLYTLELPYLDPSESLMVIY